jgi:enamine deaminase RidA (YjgF/YER057c/UK114 family)
MQECDAAISNSPGAILDVVGAAPERTDLCSYGCRENVCVCGLRHSIRAPGTSFTRQAENALDQLMRCVEAAGSSLDRVVKCNVHCTLTMHVSGV